MEGHGHGHLRRALLTDTSGLVLLAQRQPTRADAEPLPQLASEHRSPDPATAWEPASAASGRRRVYEHALPLEDARAYEAYGIHSAVNKLLIINREITPGRITVVLVDEVLGF